MTINGALQLASLFLSNSHRPIQINASDGDLLTFSGLLIFRGKKAKFRGIFRGKFAEESAEFAGFSREKSQKLRKNRLISQDFSGKKSNFEGFSGANA